MVKINLVGGIFGTSGYASHTRQLAEALIKINPDTKVETQLVEGWELQCSDSLLKAIKRERYTKQEGGVIVYIGMPQTWSSVASTPNNGFYPYLIWEGNKIPKSFIAEFDKANRVIVPSEHVFEAVENTDSSVLNKIAVVPHGVDTDLFRPVENKNDTFIFCANKGWASGIRDRGGVQFLIKAFTDEFNKDEKVNLRLKINTAYCPPGWNLDNELRQLGLREQHAPIHINGDNLEYKEIVKLYEGADCFVSPTMGEAFSIPCVEAMSCGLPVITTNFGGQIDFVDNEKGWLIPYSLVEVRHNWEYEGISWALPDMNELRRLMRYAFNHRQECKEKGKKAREYIVDLTWDNSASLLLDVINEEQKNRNN